MAGKRRHAPCRLVELQRQVLSTDRLAQSFVHHTGIHFLLVAFVRCPCVDKFFEHGSHHGIMQIETYRVPPAPTNSRKSASIALGSLPYLHHGHIARAWANLGGAPFLRDAGTCQEDDVELGKRVGRKSSLSAIVSCW